MIYCVPLCIIAAHLSLVLRYMISGNSGLFGPIFKYETYIKVLAVIVSAQIICTILLLLIKVDVPDTNLAGYRRFILDKFRA